MEQFDRDWLTEVCAWCDPVFERADVGFVRQESFRADPPGLVATILWEADPPRFAARYPDSGIIETYGEENFADVHCIDFWVHLDHQQRRARFSVEGWSLPEIELPLRGPVWDGYDVAAVFARILGLPEVPAWHPKCWE